MNKISRILFCLLLTAHQSFCKVTSEIKSKVALNNTNAIFTCSGYGATHLEINKPNSLKLIEWDQIPLSYEDQSINVTGSEEVINNKNIKTIVVDILAIASNNGTELTCHFADSETEQTGPAILYVADEDTLGKAAGFQNPTVSYNTNRKSITISWSPPWSYPVNSYTVTVNNRTDNSWKEYTDLADDSTQWSMEVDTTQSNCHDLKVYVTALTDVGITRSNIFTTGFPIELEKINKENISVNLLMKKSGKLKTEIDYNAPMHCSGFQQILYNFTIHDNNHPHEIKYYKRLSQPKLESEGFIVDKGNYRLEATYWDNNLPETEKIVVTKYFYTNFTLPTPGGDSMTNVTSTTAAAPTSSSSSTSSSSTNCITELDVYPDTVDHKLVYITAAIGGTICILLIISIAVLVLVVVRIRKRIPNRSQDVEEIKEFSSNDKSTEATTADKETNKKERKTSVPKMMATNPLYEGSATLYSYVPDELKALKEKPTTATTIGGPPKDMRLEIPPQLPPPRKMSLDSPGIKTGVQLSLDKRRFLSGDLPSGVDCNDQYVAMRSASELRYCKSPLVTKLQFEETLNDGGSKYPPSKAIVRDNKEESSMDKI